jgi:hypothetical protein
MIRARIVSGALAMTSGGRTASTAEINFDDARVVLNEVDRPFGED